MQSNLLMDGESHSNTKPTIRKQAGRFRGMFPDCIAYLNFVFSICFYLGIYSGASPLCLYVFSSNKDIQQLFENNTTSGTMAFNDTIVQFASEFTN